MSNFSRRGFMKALAVSAGAAAGTRFGGSSLVGSALAAPEPTSVLILHFAGGYNSIFSSAAPLTGSFGVRAGNFTALGNGVSVDNVLAGAYSNFVRSHVATIGVAHGQSAHAAARGSLWSNGGKCYAHELAAAIGGNGANKALLAGRRDIPERPLDPVGGVALQQVLDLDTYLRTLGIGAPRAREPSRALSLPGIEGAQIMSDTQVAENPRALLGLGQGYTDAVATLEKAPAQFDMAELLTAYKLGTRTNINDFAAQMASAEAFIRTGTNVVSVVSGGWDTHDDIDGTRVRNQMGPIAASLKVFLDRMVTADAPRNVVVVMLGDFARSLPGSDHQPNLSATVIGKYVKRGTTGLVDARVATKAGTPGSKGLWAYVAAAAKIKSPFGANPHGLI